MDTLMPGASLFFAGGAADGARRRSAARLAALFDDLGVREPAERDRLVDRFLDDCATAGEPPGAAPARAERALEAWFAALIGGSLRDRDPAAAARRGRAVWLLIEADAQFPGALLAEPVPPALVAAVRGNALTAVPAERPRPMPVQALSRTRRGRVALPAAGAAPVPAGPAATGAVPVRARTD